MSSNVLNQSSIRPVLQVPENFNKITMTDIERSDTKTAQTVSTTVSPSKKSPSKISPSKLRLSPVKQKSFKLDQKHVEIEEVKES